MCYKSLLQFNHFFQFLWSINPNIRAAISPAQGGETYVTPKRTATSPLESSPKRIELPVSFLPSPPPDPNNGPTNVQLPVWDPAQDSPGTLREGRRDQDTSLKAEHLLDTDLDRDEDEVSNEEDEDDDEHGNEDDSSTVLCDCVETRGGSKCIYREAIRQLMADLPEWPYITSHWPPPTVTHRQRRDTQ